MNDKITRLQYRASIDTDYTDEELFEALESDKGIVAEAIADGSILTASIYRHENMLFLYYERLDDETAPDDLFPELSMCLHLWPEKDGLTPWAYMYHIYHHAVPENVSEWMAERKSKKFRRGRIAYLVDDEKLFSYTYYHKAIVDEGLLEGDKYQFIGLHENILFSYFEEPKHFTHIKKHVDKESEVINEWLAKDPESHFDHDLSGQDNFLLLPIFFTM